MEFPRTNKIHRSFEDKAGDNAALLEELARKFQWKLWLIRYAAALGVFLVTIFLIIVTVRFALWLF